MAQTTIPGIYDVRGYYQRLVDMLDLDRMGERLPGPPKGGFLTRHGGRILRGLGWAILLLAALAILTFPTDYAVLRYRIAAGRSPFSAVTVRPYYAVRLKSGKTQFLFLDSRQDRCVNSLFPHFGMAPCWYARRHTEKRTDI